MCEFCKNLFFFDNKPDLIERSCKSDGVVFLCIHYKRKEKYFVNIICYHKKQAVVVSMIKIHSSIEQRLPCCVHMFTCFQRYFARNYNFDTNITTSFSYRQIPAPQYGVWPCSFSSDFLYSVQMSDSRLFLSLGNKSNSS